MSTPPDSFSTDENNDDIHRKEEVATPPLAETQSKETPQPTPTTESSLPPEAQGEANGGPLGCCLGVMIGLLLSLSIAVLSRFYADPLAKALSSGLSITVRITMIIVAIIAVIVCGYFGWRLGQKAYREYDPPVIKDRHRRKMIRANTKIPQKEGN